jgi:hypothetical protein
MGFAPSTATSRVVAAIMTKVTAGAATNAASARQDAAYRAPADRGRIAAKASPRTSATAAPSQMKCTSVHPIRSTAADDIAFCRRFIARLLPSA